MEADKGMAMIEDGKNYGDFLLDTVETAKEQFTDKEYEWLKESTTEISNIENKLTELEKKYPEIMQKSMDGAMSMPAVDNMSMPSNFNYRMMEQIRLEAEKQQKRKERVMLCGMIAGILLLLGVGVYTLVFKLEFNFKEYLSGMDFSHADSSLLAFYSYIATLVLLLLGLDYWLRKKKFHS